MDRGSCRSRPAVNTALTTQPVVRDSACVRTCVSTYGV